MMVLLYNFQFPRWAIACCLKYWSIRSSNMVLNGRGLLIKDTFEDIAENWRKDAKKVAAIGLRAIEFYDELSDSYHFVVLKK